MSDTQGTMNNRQTSTPMRLLVTGATGFIGSRLALHARRNGIDVLATGRAEIDVERERLAELRAAEIPVEVGTLHDVGFVRRLVRDRTVVIHLAAAQHESHMPAAYFRSVNVDVVRQLLQECRAAAIRRFVYGSTMGVYGDASEQQLDEQSEVRPENPYQETKLEAEALVRAREYDFDTSIVRIAETYGPGDWRLLKLFRAIERGHFFMIGRGSNRRQCIHVNDLVRGLMLAAEHPAAVSETMIMAGREVMTTNEMVERIATALDRKPPRTQLPMWPFLAAATVLETTLQPLRIHPPLHRRRLDFFRRSFVFSTVKAQRLLGFTPEIDFQSGAADTARWYRSRGLLAPRAADEVAGRVESA
jgi:nucleoside-diphosphate-sugar epimerase